MFYRSLAFTACILFSFNASATSISDFNFWSEVYPIEGQSCISEVRENCEVITASGLSGTFAVDLSALDAYGNGTIQFTDLLAFNATNGFSSWTLANVSQGEVVFEHGNIRDLSLRAAQDFSAGWDERADGGGETLILGPLHLYDGTVVAGSSSSPSMPGPYCPISQVYYYPTRACPEGEEAVAVFTLGLKAYYQAVHFQAVPVPAAVWLFSSALLGLVGFKRRCQQPFIVGG